MSFIHGKKLLFLGFSVTTDPISYVDDFASRHGPKLHIASARRIGIGGITPVTLRYLITDELLKDSDIVLLEIATSDARTSFAKDREEYAASVCAIISTLISKGKTPILLDLPRSDVDYSSDWLSELHQRLAQYFGMLRIDATAILSDRTLEKKYLRDLVHPTKEGAACYSDIIAKAFQGPEWRESSSMQGGAAETVISRFASLFTCRRAFDMPPHHANEGVLYQARCYQEQVIILDEHKRRQFFFGEVVHLRGITYIMGPRSGRLTVDNGTIASHSIQAYDSYCYFERLNGSIFDPFATDTITVTQEAGRPSVTLRKGEASNESRMGKLAHFLIDHLPPADYKSLARIFLST